MVGGLWNRGGATMILHVISDLRNGRRDQLEAHLTSRKVPYQLWDAVVDPKSVVASINASHKMVVRWAANEGLSQVAIAEDDCYFPAADGWEYFINNFDYSPDIYLGGNYTPKSERQSSGGPFTSVAYPSIIGLHCYIISARWYNSFVSVRDDAHIDTAQSGGLFLAPYPFAALQRPGFSSNTRTHVDLNEMLKPEDVYGGIPKWSEV